VHLTLLSSIMLKYTLPFLILHTFVIISVTRHNNKNTIFN
jgi:hypothetical protein